MSRKVSRAKARTILCARKLAQMAWDGPAPFAKDSDNQTVLSHQHPGFSPRGRVRSWRGRRPQRNSSPMPGKFGEACLQTTPMRRRPGAKKRGEVGEALFESRSAACSVCRARSSWLAPLFAWRKGSSREAKNQRIGAAFLATFFWPRKKKFTRPPAANRKKLCRPPPGMCG